MLNRLVLTAALAASLASPALAQTAVPTVTQPYTSSSPVTPGTNVLPGRGVLLACQVAGIVRVIMKDGSTADVYASVGSAILDNFSSVGVSTTGTTATCSVSVLR